MVAAQKLGLGSDPSLDSEEDRTRQTEEAITVFIARHWDSRLEWLYAAFLLAAFVTLMEWAGFRGKLQIWDDPVPLSEVWWHFFIWFAVLAPSMKLIFWLNSRGQR